MRRGNHTASVLDDMQMGPTPKAYIDLRDGGSEVAFDKSFAEQKIRVPI